MRQARKRSSLAWPALRVAVVTAALLAACARQQVEVRDLAPEPEAALPPVEIHEVVLGPGDEVEVFVWRQPELTRKVKISRTGHLPYPLIGDVRVVGLTAPQLRDVLRDNLGEYLKDPQVSVAIAAVQAEKFFVLGEVRRPGVYPYDPLGRIALLDAIGLAGGLTEDAKRGEILVLRRSGNKVYVRAINFDALVEEGNLRENIPLGVGDIVYVPVSTLGSLARDAERITKILGPALALADLFLKFQSGAILWDDMARALQGKPFVRETIIVTP